MTTLIVQAHPQRESYNAALLAAVERTNPDAVVLRLGEGDRLEPTSFAGVTKLAFVYPTWWGGLPSMLLGPLAEVLEPWVDGAQAPSSSPFRCVDRLLVVTSHGSSKLVNLLQGEPGLQLWKRTVLPLCRPGATFRWKSLYKMDRVTDADRANFLAGIK